MSDHLAELLGAPLRLETLKDKPGRRRTSRAHGQRGTAIVKSYASARAPTVAARLVALAGGPPEPVLPQLLLLDEPGHRVVLSDVPGSPLRAAALAGRLPDCRRAGAALGSWHRAWEGVAPAPLQPHAIERELEILNERAAAAPATIRAVVESAVRPLAAPWRCSTVVHRDLYEEQVLVGERVGLIDLDDAALGPPELDVGNLLAHLDRLSLTSGRDLAAVGQALVAGYAGAGPDLDPDLLNRCRRLALLRLACIHRDERLARLATPESDSRGRSRNRSVPKPHSR